MTIGSPLSISEESYNSYYPNPFNTVSYDYKSSSNSATFSEGSLNAGAVVYVTFKLKEKKMRTDIEKFLRGKNYAIIGASAGKINMGRTILLEMLKRNYTIYPVHRTAENIGGINCYRSVKDVPNDTDGIILVVLPDETEKIVEEIADAGINQVWMQFGSKSEKAVTFCKEKGINVIADECVLMFLENSGFPHNFHRWIWGLIGRA